MATYQMCAWVFPARNCKITLIDEKAGASNKETPLWYCPATNFTETVSDILNQTAYGPNIVKLRIFGPKDFTLAFQENLEKETDKEIEFIEAR